MGVTTLWKVLREEGLVQTFSGADGGAGGAIAAQVDGSAVAVDLSLWLCQAEAQPDLAGLGMSRESRCIKVAFERVRPRSRRSGALPSAPG